MQELQSRFLKARKSYIASRFPTLNSMQLKAAMHTQGPLLLLAGAGSGKTTVLINRIANLIRYGRGSDSDEMPYSITEQDVLFLERAAYQAEVNELARADELAAIERAAPWSILAITFTNKAAGELKERLAVTLGAQAEDIWAMTFHSACCRILRRDIEAMGYSRSFTIYDTNDSERMMKSVLKELEMDEKTFPPRYVLSAISRQKDQMKTPEDLHAESLKDGDLKTGYIARAYKRYQELLAENNALDFDDIIFVTVKLLQSNSEILRYYQRKFKYIMVDEYQDTNRMQYLLTSLLAGGSGNICVVGDDDQSIYRFRGATIDNILSFEKHFPGAEVIRLEQNYRSTQSILDAANAVISHNVGRKGKKLWTDNDRGEPVCIYEAADEGQEANFVAGQILARSKGKDLKNFAVLYRTNAQSNALEYAMKRNGISYKVFGGMKFFDRAEVKDILSYMCVVNNPNDTLRLNRIVNNPPRGLGAKTLEAAIRLADAEGTALYNVMLHADQYSPLEKNVTKYRRFTNIFIQLQEMLEQGISLLDFYDELLRLSGYMEMLSEKESEEAGSKIENINELKSSIQSYIHEAEEPSLSGFLEEIALYTDIEQYDSEDNSVVMMTMHSAKGLEFPHVFIVGMEEGLFPGQKAIMDYSEMEEERRLCYVAITRAQKTLTISRAHQRMLYGKTTSSLPSRFLQEIPENCTVRRGGSVNYNRMNRKAGQPMAYSARNTEAAKPGYLSRSAGTSRAMIEFKAGDLVMHRAFGKGLVLTVVKMPGDALLEIAFDSTGTRKLMAKSASEFLKKL